MSRHARVRELLGEGLSLREIAFELDMSIQQVSALASPSRARRLVIELHEKGRTQTEIAELVGVSRQVVHQHLKLEGLLPPVRPRKRTAIRRKVG